MLLYFPIPINNVSCSNEQIKCENEVPMLFSRNCHPFFINTTCLCVLHGLMELLENYDRDAVYGYGQTAEIKRHEVS